MAAPFEIPFTDGGQADAAISELQAFRDETRQLIADLERERDAERQPLDADFRMWRGSL